MPKMKHIAALSVGAAVGFLLLHNTSLRAELRALRGVVEYVVGGIHLDGCVCDDMEMPDFPGESPGEQPAEPET